MRLRSYIFLAVLLRSPPLSAAAEGGGERVRIEVSVFEVGEGLDFFFLAGLMMPLQLAICGLLQQYLTKGITLGALKG